MKSCAIIINNLSGNSDTVDEARLINTFGYGYKSKVIPIHADTVLGDLSEYERIVLCGGDGTLNSVINCNIADSAQLFYIPSGTFNESRNSVKREMPLRSELGKAGDRLFSYVCAAGIFTPLGYVVSSKKKKRWKKLAYFSRILHEYKVHRINASFEIDGQSHSGQYSLLMAVDSRQCFGFKFNKMFRYDDGMLHFLAIKAPKGNGFFGKVALFFPLFRAFFVGFRKPYRSKKMLFVPGNQVTLTLDQPTPFDMDGERVDMQDTFQISIVQQNFKIRIVNHDELREIKKELLAQQKKAAKSSKKKK